MDIEPTTLIWIARLVFLTLALLIAWGVWHYLRRERTVLVDNQPSYRPPRHIELPEKNIALAVMAKPGYFFDSLKLFKVMHELGFHYADNHIFEYFVPGTKYIAFSVINRQSSNTFDPNPETMKPTNGLIAIMQLPVADGDHQSEYFHLLLSLLDELCNNLDADLCDLNNNLIRDKKLYDIQKSIESFEQSYLAFIQNDYQRSHS